MPKFKIKITKRNKTIPKYLGCVFTNKSKLKWKVLRYLDGIYKISCIGDINKVEESITYTEENIDEILLKGLWILTKN